MEERERLWELVRETNKRAERMLFVMGGVGVLVGMFIGYLMGMR